MNVSVNKKENSRVEIEFKIEKEEFLERLEVVFKKNAKNFKVPGYRPGKAPRDVIEKMYGADSLNYSVIEEFIDEDYKKAVEENKFDIVSQPSLDVKSVSREEGAVYTVSFDVMPEAKLNKYKGLEIEFKEKKITKKDVDAELENIREKNARTVTVEDKALKADDIANINFEGFKDEVAFEGGKAENFDLTIGSGAFIPGFEEALIGMKIGENRDINVTFPKEYQVPELAGAPVVFKVVLNSISEKILPELNDDFVKDISEEETLEAYTKKVKADLVKKADSQNKADKELAAFEALVNELEVVIPESMIVEEVKAIKEQNNQQLAAQGLNLETYCQYLGMDMAVMEASFKEQAEKNIKLRLALDTLGKMENIEVTDEEIDTKIDELVSTYGNESKTNFKDNDNIKKYLTEQLKQEKLIALVVDNVVIKK